MNASRLSWHFSGDKTLFDFAFAENHMLAGPRIIFFQFKLFRLSARVLFGHVKIASVGCTYEFNLKGCWLRHDTYSLMSCCKLKPDHRLSLKKISSERAVKRAKCQACITVFLICLIVALSPFYERLRMIDGAETPAFVSIFCQFYRHRPTPIKCRQKQRSLQLF